MELTAVLDIAAIGAEVEARAIGACPTERRAVRRLLARLTPPRWTLEWSLPWWFGNALGVERTVTEELVAANVLGLAAFRLHDDIADGETPIPAERAERLAAALHDAALATYRRRFPADARTWVVIAAATAEWGGAHGQIELASRGAPLRISVSAVCELAGRPDLEASLHAAVDHALRAWVLADDASDWKADVAVGRANAYVARLAGGAATVDDVHLALLTTDGARRYHEQIQAEAERAAALADAAIGPSPFADHVRGFGRRAQARGRRLHARYHALTERATRMVFDGALE